VTRFTCMASMPNGRMGLPPRSLAADAHDCIMVRIPSAIHRIQACGAMIAPPAGRLASDHFALELAGPQSNSKTCDRLSVHGVTIIARHALSPSTPRA
jgi:hypothetical protein